MGPEDKIEFTESLTDDRGGNIPGLDLDLGGYKDRNMERDKKVPYSKPIPRNFQAQWNDTGRPDDDEFGSAVGPLDMGDDGGGGKGAFDGMPDMSVQPPNMGGPPPPIQQPSAIVVYGKTIAVKRKLTSDCAMNWSDPIVFQTRQPALDWQRPFPTDRAPSIGSSVRARLPN